MSSRAQGIILAGVHQWRPSAFEQETPRALVPIGNRPLLEYPIAWLRDGGITGIEICANSDTAAIRSRLGFGESQRVQINYYEDHFPRGPAGCVADATSSKDLAEFVVLDASILPQSVNLDKLLQAHRKAKATLTVVASHDGRDENGRNSLTPVGIYVFSHRAMRYINAAGYQDIKEMLIPRLYEAGESIITHVIDKPLVRVTGAGSCFLANEFALRRLLDNEPGLEGFRRQGEALVHETAILGSTTRLIGPVLIGEHTILGDQTTLIGPTTVGRNCRLEDKALICRSILWDHVRVEQDAIIDNCIMTHQAHIQRGTRSTRQIHRG